MAFFRTAGLAESMAAIDGDRVALRMPQMSDFPEWAALRAKSRDFLKQTGVELNYREYPIAHQVSPEELSDAKEWLTPLL